MTPTPATVGDRSGPWALWAGWGLFALLLLLALPLFLCLPLTPDVLLYDICARNVLQGGVHYRNVCENNMPGVVWFQSCVCGLKLDVSTRSAYRLRTPACR